MNIIRIHRISAVNTCYNLRMWYKTYIHDLPEWPNFTWRHDAVTDLLADIRHQQGLLLGRVSGIGFDLKQQAALNALTETVVKSSEIEGEVLNVDEVRSSVASRLGIDIGGYVPTHRDVDGIVEIMVDATSQFDTLLTKDRLSVWHAQLFPYGWGSSGRMVVGAWRKPERDPMQVVSGAMGQERVHFQAPSANRLEAEMEAFLKWFNESDGPDDVLKAALAHLWFVTIHPFDDGNGRIARAIADMALARSDGVPQRFYSMSAQIRKERPDYYRTLETTQKGDLDVTMWLVWFLECLGRALEAAQETVSSAIVKVQYWDSIADVPLNERQHKVIRRLVNGFEGKLTSAKWAKLTKASQDTALRDITDLMEKGVLKRGPAGGRSTSYLLVESAAR